jgi:hypothetical protein
MISQKQPLYQISHIQATRKAFQVFSEAISQSKVTIKLLKQQLGGLSKPRIFSRQVQTL